MRDLFNRPRRSIRRYLKNRNGTTAIEFALLALPFSALLFAIIETAVVFFITSTMSHATSEAARQIRVGNFQAGGGGQAEFKDLVCAGMSGIGNCNAKLRIDVVTSADGTFASGMLPVTPDDESDPTIPPSTYTCTQARDVVIVRAQYFHQLSLPNSMTFLSNRADNKTRLIQSTTAFRNEPFGIGCS